MAQRAERRKDEDLTGRNLPDASGEVSDEDVKAITDDHRGRKIGQDHSTDNYGETMPESGVGAVQDNSDSTSDIARISENE